MFFFERYNARTDPYVRGFKPLVTVDQLMRPDLMLMTITALCLSRRLPCIDVIGPPGMFFFSGVIHGCFLLLGSPLLIIRIGGEVRG